MVDLERDETGRWTATVPEMPGCLTQGHTIEQTMRRVRKALELFDVDSGSVRLIECVHLPAQALRAVEESQATRTRAEEERLRAQSVTKEAARLLEELGLSVRDAAKLLGLSHQRVQQLRHSEG